MSGPIRWLAPLAIAAALCLPGTGHAGAGTDGLFNAAYFEKIEAHLDRAIGPSTHVWHELVSPEIHVDLVPIPPDASRPFWTIVTAGMSYKPMTIPAGSGPEWRRAELMILLPADWAGDLTDQASLQDEGNWAPFRLLKELARFPHENGTFLAPGHTVDLGRPVSPGSQMTSAMVHWAIVLNEDDLSIATDDGELINFYAVYPIHPDEREGAMKNGSDSIFDLMLNSGTGLIFDPSRPSLLAAQ